MGIGRRQLTSVDLAGLRVDLFLTGDGQCSLGGGSMSGMISGGNRGSEASTGNS